MDANNDIHSSEDEFDFTLFQDNLDNIMEDMHYSDQYTSSEDNIDNIGVRKRKIRVIESDTDSEAVEDEHCSEWEDVTESESLPSRITFTNGQRATGPHVSANVTEPYHFLKLFFTDRIINGIINETNYYARTKLANKELSQHSIWQTWKEVTKEEFLAFIAIILNMGTMPVANIQEYWSKQNNSRIPFFPNTFTRKRFNQIFWMLHLKTIPNRSTDIRNRVQRVSSFLEEINLNFLEYFVPGQNISVDEAVVKFKGKIAFITFNPKKPTKWGIRIYMLCDSETGYTCVILPYYGSVTTENLVRPDLPVSTRIPLHLYKKLLEKVPGAQGYHLFTDRYYTSLILAEELLKLKCHLTGTIQVNRKGLPRVIKKPKFGKRKIVALRKGNNLVLAWKDKRVVTMLTNWNNAEMIAVKRFERGGVHIEIKKPKAVINYSKCMGGVDRADQYASTYCFLRKSLKWWRKLFFWGLEICVINSFILYKLVKQQRNERPLSHLKYVKLLIDQLKGDFQDSRGVSTSTDIHTNVRLNRGLHVMLTGRVKDCRVCSYRTEKGKRHQTTYFCDTCPEKPAMHLGECFIKYHTQQNYRA